MPFRLWDRIRDWVVLAVLLVSAVGVMLFENEPLLRGMRAGALDATSWVEARFAWVGRFSRALDENEILRRDNIDLSSELARLREARLENERLRRLIAFRDSTDHPMVGARIVSKDLFEGENLLTLDVGRADCVDVDMAVLDERGILGKVIFVSENYSRVLPYKNTSFRVPAKVQEIGAVGIARWPGTQDDLLSLDHVVKTEPVEKGQLVVTSGFSSVFPAGFPIGRVDSVALRHGRNELDILVRPLAKLGDAEHAFVLIRRPDPERLALEERRLE